MIPLRDLAAMTRAIFAMIRPTPDETAMDVAMARLDRVASRIEARASSPVRREPLDDLVDGR